MSERRKALGRGLGALIPTGPGSATGAEGGGDTPRPPRAGRPVDVFFPAGDPYADPAGLPSDPVGSPSDGADPAAPSDGSSDTSATGEGATVGGPESATAEQPDAAAAEPASDAAGTASSGSPAARTTRPATRRDADDGLRPVPGATFARIAVDDIEPNRAQPRTVFAEEELSELAASIAEVGMLQPVVVRPYPDPEDGDAPYELIMGERRWRAARQAGLSEIPTIVRSTTDDDLLRDALLENLHRVQLNPLEEAAAYQQLLEDFGCTHEELSARIARSRPQISNTLRLLRLPALVQRRVAAGVLSAGHARALLGLSSPAAMERLAQRIVAEGLSVRATEEAVALGEGHLEPARRRPRAGMSSPALDDLAGRLADRLDTKVKVNLGQRKGRISIEFASVQDLNRILGTLAPDDPGVFRPGTADDGDPAGEPTP